MHIPTWMEEDVVSILLNVVGNECYQEVSVMFFNNLIGD
jgi:hypothetical protein